MIVHCKGILAQPRLSHAPYGWTQQRGDANIGAYGADPYAGAYGADADNDADANADADNLTVKCYAQVSSFDYFQGVRLEESYVAPKCSPSR